MDALRGAIMIIMALDHVRDFMNHDAMLFAPDDLTKTNALFFFTRWITHFCAPVFALTAGMGAGFWLLRPGRTKPELSRFLLTRGLWLIFLEVTVMRFGYYFTMDAKYPVLMLVFWSLGAGMVALAGLIYVPARVLAVLSLLTICLHNLLDPLQAKQFGALAPLWTILHERGAIVLPGVVMVIGYPLLAWIAVMAAGFCFAPHFHRKPAFRIGLICTLAFVLIRALNMYGDPAPWTARHSPLFTVLSFLNCRKYPPSLDYLLMTLGPALIFLGWLDSRKWSDNNPLIVFGRVPLFYFVVHFYLIHLTMNLMAWARYGNSALANFFVPPPILGGPAELFPPDFGWPLPVTYLVWISLVVALYPLCRWWGKVKATGRYWWLSYL